MNRLYMLFIYILCVDAYCCIVDAYFSIVRIISTLLDMVFKLCQMYNICIVKHRCVASRHVDVLLTIYSCSRLNAIIVHHLLNQT